MFVFVYQESANGSAARVLPENETRVLPKYIYFNELVSAFGDRMWQFAIPILFMDVWPTSLLPTILYTFVLNLAMFLLMPIAGSWIDSMSRLPLMVTTIVVDNVSVIASCFLLKATVASKNQHLLWSIFSAIVLISIPGQLAVNVGRVALEKDWVPVVCEGDSKSLTVLNSRLKIIDLSCKFIAPMIFGIILQLMGPDVEKRVSWGSNIVIMYNLLMALPEGICIYRVYFGCHRLATAPKKKKLAGNPLWKFYDGWRVFVSHPICLSCLSFSILFTTVLSPGSLLIAFLKWVGVMEGLLGASIGFGALCGLLGASLFPYMHEDKNGNERISLSTIGLSSVWLWFLHLFPIAVVLIIRQSNITTLPPLVTGTVILFFVCVGRTWLWVFDLAANQLLQERVSEGIRGRVSGVQSGNNQLFTVVIYALGLIFHRPDEFYILCYASIFSVLLSAILFTVWYIRYSDISKFTEAVPLSMNTTPEVMVLNDKSA
uniref:Solute carrier family 40 member n=1 Tax=Lotharella globosa TaxID=91324 RepID=A0A7S3Z7D6_9EUKA